MRAPLRLKRTALAAAWLAALACAGILGAWSLSRAEPGSGADHPRPLDDAAVRRELARAGTPGAATTPGEPPEHSPSATRPVRFPGGSATARCLPDGRIYLVSWSPAAGYAVEEAARGPARTAALELEADDGDRTVVLRCRGSRPVAEAADDDADTAD